LAVVVEANTPDFQQLVDAAKAGDVSKLLSHVLNRDVSAADLATQGCGIPVWVQDRTVQLFPAGRNKELKAALFQIQCNVPHPPPPACD
jgi:hypothetical protein